MDTNSISKIFIMLIGVPGSGKSFFVKNTLPQLYPNEKFTIISSDNIIECRATKQNKTYSEIFRTEIKSATIEMNEIFLNAIKNKLDIIMDQTNLTPKIRRKKLLQIQNDYYKIAVAFKVPEEIELNRRLNSRPGKYIPATVMQSMISQLTPPTEDEGFNKIINL